MNHRSRHLGGSDIGVVLGLSKFKTRYELWLEKTGQVEPQPGSMATDAGHALEDMILRAYCKTRGVEIDEQVRLGGTGDRPWAAGTADGVVKGGLRGVDAKASCSLGAWRNGPPATVVCQMNWYAWLSGISTWDIALLQASAGWGFEIFTVERDDKLINEMIMAADVFWKHCQDGTPPEPVTYEDVMKMFPEPLEDEVLATPEIERLSDEYDGLLASINDMQKRKKGVRDAMARFMGKADSIVDKNGNRLRKSIKTKYGRQIR